MRRALLLALAVLIFGATMVSGRRLGMAERVTTRHVFYSIPCSISRLYFGAHALSIDDMPMIQLVRRRLVETNRADEIQEVFRPAGQEDYKYNGIAKDYVRYERVARDVVLSIVWHNKREALKTFLVDKPRVLFRQLAWAAGYGGYSTADLHLTGRAAALATDAMRQAGGIYLKVTAPLVWVGVAAAVLIGGVRRDRVYAVWCALAAWMCAASRIPALVAYPIISALGVSLATVAFFALSVVALLVDVIAARLSRTPARPAVAS